jgi:ATP-dependent Zn protease
MRRQTRRLIRKHRDKIERVATALLERGMLTAEEIDRLVASPPQS